MASTSDLANDGGPSRRTHGGPQQASEAVRLPGQQPKSLPECGILSKTVVESPVANYILPARIRSNLYKDLAFVGDNFVQIVELQKDGQVHEVLRKNDFRARIRNAAVQGDCYESGTDESPLAPVKIEDVDVTMADNPNSSKHDLVGEGLPPQILVLVLENAEVLFLFINQNPDGSYEFIINNYPCETKVPYMGYHLCIDPTSRCLAIGSPEGYVLLYELESFETMSAAYARDGSFNPIRRKHAQAVHGIIHRIEFLYTRPEDNFHFIFLLVLVRREGRPTHPQSRISRMLTFEWVVGDDLCRVFSEEKAGLRLPPEHVMPLLIIPIKFRSSFFTVSAGEIGLVRNTVEGSPDFELLYTDSPDATPLHHGTYEPLWTAWARPFRRERYFEKRDVIFMAREDGAIIHIEIDGRDMVPSVTNVGCLNTNVNTAFAMSYDRFSDVIIIGGDSGPGGVWKLAPRTDLERITVIHNWSAVVDATTSNKTSFWNSGANAISRTDTRHRRVVDTSLLRPETLYSVAGRGINGGIIEWRWGIQCRIGLDLEVPEGPDRVWVFRATSHGLQGWLGILSSPHSSTILNLAENFMEAEDLSEKDYGFDDSSSTLLARQLSNDNILQITERCICIVAPSSGKRYTFEDLLERPGIRAYNAFLVRDFVVFSTAYDGLCQLHIVQVDMTRPKLINSWETHGDVTAVAGFSTTGRQFVAAALAVSGTAWLTVFSVNGKEAIVNIALDDRLNEIDEQREPTEYEALEPVTSIVVVQEEGDSVDIALGTRCGHLISARIAQDIQGHLIWQCEKLGISAVELFPVSGIFNGSPAMFACCDGRLIMLHKFDEMMQRFSGKNYLFLTDSQDDSAASPDVHSVFQMRENLTGFKGHITIAIVAGNRILVCDVWPHVGMIPRTIRLDGTPSRIFYSHTWKCLVAAVIRQDKTALEFINPATGVSISQPSDRHGATLEFITGLGHEGDRIFGLEEWSYFKDGHVFSFILVATKNGRLLIVSLKESDTVRSQDSTRKLLQYWTRYRLTLNKPIYSIVGDEDGIIYCEGNTIRWDILDLEDKRLRHVKEYELESPATTLRVRGSKIHAVTATQSLVVLDHRSGDGQEMKLVHTDEVSRPSIHAIELGDMEQTEANWPVTLMSDQVCRFVGMRVPPGESPWEHEIVFEGALSTSIRRFTFGRTRPPWSASQAPRRYGTLVSDQGGVEIFGLGLDGSMHHFQLLSKPLWRLLSLVQNLVYQDTTHYPLILPRINIEPRAEDESLVILGLRSKTAHIDGDVLERCVLDGTLRELVEKGEVTQQFCSYLDELEGGKWTRKIRDSNLGAREKGEWYFRVGQRVLGFLVQHAM